MSTFSQEDTQKAVKDTTIQSLRLKALPLSVSSRYAVLGLIDQLVAAEKHVQCVLQSLETFVLRPIVLSAMAEGTNSTPIESSSREFNLQSHHGQDPSPPRLTNAQVSMLFGSLGCLREAHGLLLAHLEEKSSLLSRETETFLVQSNETTSSSTVVDVGLRSTSSAASATLASVSALFNNPCVGYYLTQLSSYAIELVKVMAPSLFLCQTSACAPRIGAPGGSASATPVTATAATTVAQISADVKMAALTGGIVSTNVQFSNAIALLNQTSNHPSPATPPPALSSSVTDGRPTEGSDILLESDSDSVASADFRALLLRSERFANFPVMVWNAFLSSAMQKVYRATTNTQVEYNDAPIGNAAVETTAVGAGLEDLANDLLPVFASLMPNTLKSGPRSDNPSQTTPSSSSSPVKRKKSTAELKIDATIKELNAVSVHTATQSLLSLLAAPLASSNRLLATARCLREIEWEDVWLDVTLQIGASTAASCASSAALSRSPVPKSASDLHLDEASVAKSAATEIVKEAIGVSTKDDMPENGEARAASSVAQLDDFAGKWTNATGSSSKLGFRQSSSVRCSTALLSLDQPLVMTERQLKGLSKSLQDTTKGRGGDHDGKVAFSIPGPFRSLASAIGRTISDALNTQNRDSLSSTIGGGSGGCTVSLGPRILLFSGRVQKHVGNLYQRSHERHMFLFNDVLFYVSEEDDRRTMNLAVSASAKAETRRRRQLKLLSQQQARSQQLADARAREALDTGDNSVEAARVSVASDKNNGDSTRSDIKKTQNATKKGGVGFFDSCCTADATSSHADVRRTPAATLYSKSSTKGSTSGVKDANTAPTIVSQHRTNVVSVSPSPQRDELTDDSPNIKMLSRDDRKMSATAFMTTNSTVAADEDDSMGSNNDDDGNEDIISEEEQHSGQRFQFAGNSRERQDDVDSGVKFGDPTNVRRIQSLARRPSAAHCRPQQDQFGDHTSANMVTLSVPTDAHLVRRFELSAVFPLRMRPLIQIFDLEIDDVSNVSASSGKSKFGFLFSSSTTAKSVVLAAQEAAAKDFNMKHCCFIIILPSRSYVFLAPSRYEKQRWVYSIRKAIEEANPDVQCPGPLSSVKSTTATSKPSTKKNRKDDSAKHNNSSFSSSKGGLHADRDDPVSFALLEAPERYTEIAAEAYSPTEGLHDSFEEGNNASLASTTKRQPTTTTAGNNKNGGPPPNSIPNAHYRHTINFNDSIALSPRYMAATGHGGKAAVKAAKTNFSLYYDKLSEKQAEEMIALQCVMEAGRTYALGTFPSTESSPWGALLDKNTASRGNSNAYFGIDAINEAKDNKTQPTAPSTTNKTSDTAAANTKRLLGPLSRLTQQRLLDVHLYQHPLSNYSTDANRVAARGQMQMCYDESSAPSLAASTRGTLKSIFGIVGLQPASPLDDVDDGHTNDTAKIGDPAIASLASEVNPLQESAGLHPHTANVAADSDNPTVSTHVTFESQMIPQHRRSQSLGPAMPKHRRTVSGMLFSPSSPGTQYHANTAVDFSHGGGEYSPTSGTKFTDKFSYEGAEAEGGAHGQHEAHKAAAARSSVRWSTYFRSAQADENGAIGGQSLQPSPEELAEAALADELAAAIRAADVERAHLSSQSEGRGSSNSHAAANEDVRDGSLEVPLMPKARAVSPQIQLRGRSSSANSGGKRRAVSVGPRVSGSPTPKISPLPPLQPVIHQRNPSAGLTSPAFAHARVDSALPYPPLAPSSFAGNFVGLSLLPPPHVEGAHRRYPSNDAILASAASTIDHSAAYQVLSNASGTSPEKAKLQMSSSSTPIFADPQRLGFQNEVTISAKEAEGTQGLLGGPDAENTNTPTRKRKGSCRAVGSD